MGINVHIAARAESAAPSGGIAVTEATARAARQQVEFQPLGESRLRGVSRPIPLFTPVRIRDLVASEQFRGGQTLTSFVGRDDEMALLEKALTRASAGDASCMAVEGEPGQGKSRLVFEFAERCRAHGISVIEARATALGRIAPHHTALALLRAFMRLELDAPATEVADRVTTRLTELGLHDSQDVALLLDFLGMATAMAAADAGARRARLLALIGRIVRAAGAAPAVVVAEDLHGLDPSSEPFIEALVDALPGTSILMLCNFDRDMRRPGWTGRSATD
jgi:hypothetical protein